jgi:hypothetical protein
MKETVHYSTVVDNNAKNDSNNAGNIKQKRGPRGPHTSISTEKKNAIICQYFATSMIIMDIARHN